MQPRMKSPVASMPGVRDALLALSRAADGVVTEETLPRSTIDLVYVRASQINGCAPCLDMHTRDAAKAGESAERLSTVAAWREAPYFNDAERAALALTEAGTRLADRTDPVPAEVFAEAAKYYDEPALGALVVAIAAINTWNRLSRLSGQVAGGWTA
jgi:AhpD family alkylhydroperoxidase